MCTLDLTKTFYSYLKDRYGEKARSFFTKTDSLVCEIETKTCK